MTIQLSHQPAGIVHRAGCFFKRITQSRVLWLILFFGFLHPVSEVFGASSTSPATNSVSLSWNPSPDSMVVGYTLQLGTASGNYSYDIPMGNGTATTISGLASGVTYYFAVSAYDVYGHESPSSAEVSFTPGNPRAELQVGPNGTANVTVRGIAGHYYEIQATEDLKSWTAVGSLTVDVTGSSTFSDAEATNYPQRFYRIREVL